ncbi:MAG TPA: LptF/LptG family permease [Pirellulaceae bacterium]|jgi:lipopolysaccharide export system permease protein|nr:LptF/LptG family permease [Pirellulaceae bacterium]
MIPGIITRYLLWELLRSFLVVLFVLSGIFLLVGLAQEAIQEGLGPGHVLQLIPYVLPNALVYAIPATWLWAVSAVYGRLSADNELLRMKAAGISPWKSLLPVYVLGLILSVVNVGIYELGATWGYNGTQQIILHAVDEIAYGALRKNRSVTLDRFSVAVLEVKGRTMVDPVFTIFGSGDTPTISIVAESAELTLDKESNALIVDCVNGEMTTSKGDSLIFDRISQPISLGASFEGGAYISDNPAHRPLASIPQDIADQKVAITQLEAVVAAEIAFETLTGNFAALVEEDGAAIQNTVDGMQNRLDRLRLEPQRRTATGFGCLFFAMMGAPLALWLRNGDFVSSFFICFLPILLIYYPFFMFGLNLAKSGDVPPVAIWLANVALGAIGVFLLRFVLRR